MSDEKAEILAAKIISKFKEIREAKKMSQYRVAELSGLSRESIRLIEKGDNSPTLVSLIRIANALETSLTDIISAVK